MANKRSKSFHNPERTCVVCKKKKDKRDLIRFIIMGNAYVIDYRKKLPARGYYLCQDNHCLTRLDKWFAKHLKKKRKK